MRSGELARLAGLSCDSLRHYERLGILPKPPRTAGGYRDYPSHALGRVRLIRRALSVGFSLAELTTVLKIRDQGGAPCHRVRGIAEKRLVQVKQQIRELGFMRRHLERLLEDWDARLSRAPGGEKALVLETLMDVPVAHRAAPLRENRKGGRV